MWKFGTVDTTSPEPELDLTWLHTIFGNGRSPEAIFDAFPSIGSLAKVYGAITFILEHPKEIEAYLEDQDRRYEEIKTRYPLTPGMIERFERGKSERAEKQA